MNEDTIDAVNRGAYKVADGLREIRLAFLEASTDNPVFRDIYSRLNSVGALPDAISHALKMVDSAALVNQEVHSGD